MLSWTPRNDEKLHRQDSHLQINERTQLIVQFTLNSVCVQCLGRAWWFKLDVFGELWRAAASAINCVSDIVWARLVLPTRFVTGVLPSPSKKSMQNPNTFHNKTANAHSCTSCTLKHQTHTIGARLQSGYFGHYHKSSFTWCVVSCDSFLEFLPHIDCLALRPMYAWFVLKVSAAAQIVTGY